MKRKMFALAAAAALTLSLAACGGPQAPSGSGSQPGSQAGASGPLDSLEAIELSYAHMGSETAMVGQWGQSFKQKVEAASGGKITVNIFSNGEMGSDAEAIESVLDNTIQIAGMQPSPAVAFVPELSVFDLPCAFSTSTAEEINQVLNQSGFKTSLDGYFANAGLKCLGFTQGATFREFSSNKKIESIEDFKGLNMRVMDNQYQIKFWGDMGCNTTPVPGAELYMSLQNGLVDSQENALDTVVAGSMNEVQDYITLTHHSLYTNMMVMSKSYFDSLPAAYQEILETAIAETASEMISVYAEANQTAYDTLVDGGMEINEMSEDQHAEMLKIAEPVYNSVREKIGDEAVDALLNAIH